MDKCEYCGQPIEHPTKYISVYTGGCGYTSVPICEDADSCLQRARAIQEQMRPLMVSTTPRSNQ